MEIWKHNIFPVLKRKIIYTVTILLSLEVYLYKISV